MLERLFDRTDGMQQEFGSPELSRRLAGRMLFNVFYEPSTRTRMSFSAAAQHLGMHVTTTENAREFSSMAKGESLEDTIRVLCACRPDVIVLRHYETGAAERAAAMSSVAIINAGDGQGQHPTQALLDLYTIRRERGAIDGSVVVIGGDLARGRTARSLAYLLGKFEGISIIFVSPRALRIGLDIKDYLARNNVPHREEEDLQAVLPQADAVYWTRTQRERPLAGELSDGDSWGRYVIGPAEMERMKPDAVLLHPLPRNEEIATAVDGDPRAAYFRQAGNGMVIRMALLEWVLADGQP